jgi:hypothetical protein
MISLSNDTKIFLYSVNLNNKPQQANTNFGEPKLGQYAWGKLHEDYCA